MEFNKEKYKVYTWKNWMMLHWILNPGIAINELILGQRVPKLTLEIKSSDKPRIERSLVPCPYCQTLHDGRVWSATNGTAFKNWFGLYCNNCGNIIPCLTNVISFLILVITFPIWGWFSGSLKAKWLEKQPQRYENIKLETTPNTNEKTIWLKAGFKWGAFMFFTMSICFPFFAGHEINWKTLLLGFVIWTISGLGYGYIMKSLMNTMNRENQKNKVATK